VLERSKAVTAFAGEPDFTYHLFDTYAHDGGFEERLNHVQGEHEGEDRIDCVSHTTVYTADQARDVEQLYVDLGYEGAILRHPKGPYKNGRSTVNEGYLMKLKRFTDGEALVIRLEEAQQNNNALERDELGRAKRTSHQENKSGKGMIGTFICLDAKWGEIRVSPGIMTHAERTALWNHPASILGKTIHWRSFGYGNMNAPRFARYYGIREDL
jgi:DNA ligase-1